MDALKSLLLTSLLILAQVVLAQKDYEAVIRKQFKTYQDATLQEKMYVHTDKSTYVAGEIIWLKAYNTDATQHKLLNLSKIAYVEIRDSRNNAVVQLKLQLAKGVGAGSAALPLGLATGRYKLRAYTAWMKNFGAAHFFERPISIINTLRALTQAAADTTAYTVQVFPEGGNLVNGLQSKVALKVTGSDGNGVDFKAMVVGETGTVIARTRAVKFGTGTFLLTPAQGHNYQVAVTLPSGRVLKKEVPRAQEEGYVMHVDKTEKNKIEITVEASTANRTNTIYLVAHNRQMVQYAEQKKLVAGKATFLPDTAAFKEGITYFTLFTEDQKPVCERLYFKKPEQRVHLQAKSDQALYGTRKKVHIDINAIKESSNLTPLNLSLSVYKWDSMQRGSGTDILNYLWLTSELAGTVEAPEYYFSDSATVEATDNLMLTHGWRRFRWQPVLNGEKPVFRFPLEYDGHLVKALITDVRTGTPAAEIATYLSIPGNPFHFYVAQSDSAGIACFNVKGHYGPGELVLQTNTRYDSVYRVEVIRPFAAPDRADTLPGATFSKAHAMPLLRQSIGMQVQQIYSKDSIATFRLPGSYDTVPFFGKPDFSYALDAYTRFQTMEEVLREYVRAVNVVLRRGDLHLLVLDAARREFFQDNELILLDGIPLFDKNKIFSYDPLKVRKVDVVPKKYFFGPALFHGIVSFSTYNGTYEGFPLDPRAVVVDYEGLQLEREFYAPVYETANQYQSRLPDFRNTLFWKPYIELQPNGTTAASFYTSDQKGSYLVVIEGMDAEGNAAVTHCSFDVK